MPPFLRSFLAIFAGYMAMAIAVIALTLLFVKTMGLKSGHPTPAYLVANVIYSILAAAFGGYITARLAGRKPLQHAAVLAFVVFVMGVISYRHYTGLQPLWYQYLMQIAAPISVLAGAALSRPSILSRHSPL